MSICRTTISARSLQCLAAPIALSSPVRQGEHFTVATSIVGSRTFPSWQRAMRRSDLMDDPRFSTAAARRLNFGALHQIIQSWMLTFPDMATLDAQFGRGQDSDGRNPLDQGTHEVGLERLLGRGPTRFEPQRRRIQIAGPPLAFFQGRADPDRDTGFPGEHNREVFAELGVSEPELQRLSEAGVLVTHHRVLVPDVAAKPRESRGRRPDRVPLWASPGEGIRPSKRGWLKQGSPAINDRELQRQ